MLEQHLDGDISNAYLAVNLRRQMLKSVSAWAKEHSIPIQVSMEERMACGIGACLGCGVKIQKSGEPDWKYLRVCKDGPVFSGEEVVWDE